MFENVGPKRPRQLWVAIITMYLQALLNGGSGILLLYLAGVEADHGRPAPELSVMGYVSLLIGVVLVACAVLLTRGVSWARYPVIVIEALGIIGGVIAIFSGVLTAVAGMVLSVLVLVNLFHSDVRLWFDPLFSTELEPATTNGGVENRIARVSATSREIGDPPLSAELQAAAARLVQLGPSALGSARAKVRAIGKELHRAGGVPLMRATLHHAEVLSLQQNSTSILREIEMAWNNIGDWSG